MADPVSPDPPPKRKRGQRITTKAPPGDVINGLEHVPTPETRARVSSLAVVCTHDGVANLMGMSKNTLEKHYSLELRTAKDSANAKVGGVLYREAISGKNLGATIFWLKAQAGWREKHVMDDQPDDIKRLGLAALIVASGLRDNPQDAIAYDQIIEGSSERVK